MMLKVLIFLTAYGAVYSGPTSNVDVADDAPIKIYSTTKTNQDFVLTQTSFGGTKDATAFEATINDTVKYQKIVGFGGTFTDATGININKLSGDLRQQVLEALFGNDGIAISLCRVPIGGTEFSTRLYTLDDHEGDTTLQHFSLQKEDLVDKVLFYSSLNFHHFT